MIVKATEQKMGGNLGMRLGDNDFICNEARRYVICNIYTFSLLRAGVGGMRLVLAWSSLK